MTLPPQPQDHPQRGQGLALVGYRGSGKTTVGRILADRLSRPFLDADLEIETRVGRPIAAIFADAGEPAFRDLEERTLRELVQRHPRSVLASGGGAVLRPSNRRLLREFGFVVWLRSDPTELARRLEADSQTLNQRPALTTAGTIAEIRQVLSDRASFYEEAADAAVETLGRTPDDVATRILEVWRRY